MDRVDLTQAALEALQPSTVTTSKTLDNDEAHSVRGKILGVLIRMCRLEAERTVAECASFVKAEPQLVEAWEYGENVPSLPQLELLARFLNRRVSEPGSSPLSEERVSHDEYLLLRRRIIGGMLRAARESIGQTIKELSAHTGVEADLLERFEFGEEKIPVSNLTALAQAVKKDLSYFLAQPYDVPERSPSNSLGEAESDNDVTWRQFAADSENRAFIRLAMAFQYIERDEPASYRRRALRHHQSQRRIQRLVGLAFVKRQS